MHESKRYAVFGASGFAREVADIALALGADEVVFLDREPSAHDLFGFRLLPESEAGALHAEGFLFALGLGDNALRARVHGSFEELSFPALIHPAATFGNEQRQHVESRPGTVVTAGVRFTSNIEVGRGCVFNLNCTVGHDCLIEDYVNIAPGATISGNVHLREGAYVGTGANIIQGQALDEKLVVGSGAVVGAGAVVSKPVPAGVTVVGVPAKPLGTRNT